MDSLGSAGRLSEDGLADAAAAPELPEETAAEKKNEDPDQEGDNVGFKEEEEERDEEMRDGDGSETEAKCKSP